MKQFLYRSPKRTNLTCSKFNQKLIWIVWILNAFVVSFQISNAPMIIFPIVWLIKCEKYWKTMSRDILAFSVIFIVVGICSAYFHATLSMMGQLLDDWSILCGEATGVALWTPERYIPAFLNGNRCVFSQVCIPVGCVPPACCSYLPACTGGVCSRGVSALGGDLLPRGVCSWRGVSFPEVYPSMQWSRHPPCTDRHP